jgi:putative copper resistance protein D
MPPPTPARVLLDWQLDPALAAVVLLAGGLYLRGVRTLAARGRAWSRGRTVAFLAGLATMLFATQSGLAAYDTVRFSLHTLQHVLLGMAAPLLLALGAPVTLALQASGRAQQRVLLRVVHSRVLAVATSPFVGWTLFAGTLFGLYFSPLFELSLRNDLVHVAVHLHFLAVGVLFFWPAVGLDPSRRPLPHPARLLYVLVALPFHAFLGLAVRSSEARPLGGDVYGAVDGVTRASLLADQRLGAGLLWAVGDLLGLVAAAVVVTQWMAADERRQAREDRRLDAGLEP